jgi:hypothetical protein
MNLINATRMSAGYTIGMAPSGRESLVVVIKGTFALPRQGEAVRLHEQQLPLLMTDTFTGAPGLSAPYAEVDFAPCKPRCDILLQGSAYAPQGRPVARVAVALRVGGWSKSFAVVGQRRWQVGAAGVGASAPRPFEVMPISYDGAFGGTDRHHADPARHAAFARNPVGRGFRAQRSRDALDGTLLPDTEQLQQPVDRPDGDFAPMAFGPIGRHWEPRARYAGTYDARWLEHDFPFLPADFSEQYFQAAPHDQQLVLAPGSQDVELANLTPDGARRFTLPHFVAPVSVFARGAEPQEMIAALDTIMFEPDLERFSLTWRAARPLRRDLFEIEEVLVGRPGEEALQQYEQLGFSS